jgi:predicted Fe-S protein YdhL (DUF1289 family)
MNFREAVEATPSVQGQYRPGLRALSAGHAARIRCDKPRRLTGSINVDRALQVAQPNAPRWDYGIGCWRGNKEVAVWVEVHPAASTSVTDMLKKLQWLKNWLRTQAPALAALTQGDYYWVSTDATIAITKNTPQAKRLAAAGLRGPKRVLQLT